MKKTLIFSLMFIMLLSLSACGKKEEKKEITNKLGGLEVVDNNTLMGWLKRGKVVECKIASPEGDIIMKTKNKAVYMEGIPYVSMDSSGNQPEAANGVMLNVGDWTYMWDKVTKKGTKINNKEMKALAPKEENKEEESDKEEWENMAEEWENSGFEYSCKETKVSDSLFEEPKDIEFTNINEMMKGLSDIGKNLEEQMNGGDMNLEDLEAQTKDLQ